VGYVAAKGGLQAILAAEELVRRKRDDGPSAPLATDQITDRLRLAVDRVMGEGGLWAPELAARALRQTEGDTIEAAQLLRAHRSTLPRLATSCTASTDEARLLRRIVPAYRTPPGPQLLGRTLDYVGRMLDTTEPNGHASAAPTGLRQPADSRSVESLTQAGSHGRLYEVLREADLLIDRRNSDRAGDDAPYDITRRPVLPGAPRSARLAVMARAETGALVNLWYRNILGPDGYLHEVTLGEVRHGRLPVSVNHPRTGAPVTVGEVRFTEVEAIEDLDGADEDNGRFDVGYGLVLGHNERKAIAMANLDIAVERDGGRSPLEQSVLQTTDGLDASGFLEHLKLPHYVTFRSMVERKLAVRAAKSTEDVK
jgi:alpha-D-ribose 1-methylphosphonate 5-triphosphate synthase subunit PhnI